MPPPIHEPGTTLLNSRYALQVAGRDGNLPAEARVLTNVFQFGRVLRIGMQNGFDLQTIGKSPVVVFFRPDRRSFDDERFAVRIEFVGHGAK